MEVWLHSFSLPGRGKETARKAEAWGFDGLLFADSQNLGTDVWIELALAAEATERLLIGPGVTNVSTRHPSVTASAAATLQVESGGRAVLTLGRGDSALRQLGREPAHVAELESATAAIQSYLRGEDANLDDFPSRLSWLDSAPEMPKVPVAIAASGPHVIEVAARHAEGIDFAIGAEVDRLRWGIDLARQINPGLSLGAFLNVGVDPDPAAARELVLGSAGIFARFSAEGAPPDGLSDVTRGTIERIADDYDESKHGQASADHAQALSDDFVSRFAVAGTPEQVTARLREIEALGIERVVVVPCSIDTPLDALDRSNQLFAADVLPQLR